nr:hypothetical protein [Tanacetum cinerariifolium]
PKPYYNELNKVAIGYKNPLCLTHAKQVQPALYNGHEIIKDNHVSAIVHNTEDTLEIAKITRRKMNDKMKDTEFMTHKQIFWSQDLIKLKSEALKEQTIVSRPIKALTVCRKGVFVWAAETAAAVERGCLVGAAEAGSQHMGSLVGAAEAGSQHMRCLVGGLTAQRGRLFTVAATWGGVAAIQQQGAAVQQP